MGEIINANSSRCAKNNGCSLTPISVGTEHTAVGLGGSRLGGSVTMAVVAGRLDGASLRGHLGYSDRNEKT